MMHMRILIVKSRISSILFFYSYNLVVIGMDNNSFNHLVSISDRKNIVISGVKKLESFDSKEFFLESVMGYIVIRGNNLELIKLDNMDGKISIKGRVSSLSYLDKDSKAKESMLSKLFK